MGDSYGDPQNNQRNQGHRDDSRGNFRSGRGPGSSRAGSGREGGGFRIRLSDNELKAARSLQDAFNLRSTVAVLGFSIRTLAQMLEEGKLGELVAQSQSESNNAGGSRNETRQGSKRNQFDGGMNNSGRGNQKPNPFARPQKPQPVSQEDPLPVEEEIRSNESQPDDQDSSFTEGEVNSENKDATAQPEPNDDKEKSSQLSES